MMDARIGQLMRNGAIVHYAYVSGYAAEPVEGTREQVEIALGLRAAPAPAAPVKAAKPAASKEYNVLITFQYPAWNEVNGIPYNGIFATSKREANDRVRNMARDDGHIAGGKGRVTLTATLVEGN